MDKGIIALAVVVLTSGCMHSGAGVPTTSTSSTGSGLQVATFDVSDDSLGPGQTGIISLELVNHHRKEIDPEDISLYNTGILVVEKNSCSPETLTAARPDFKPRMKCSWTVEVPEGAVGGFESKTVPVKLNLEYQSSLSNSKQPVKVHFRPIEEIDRTNPLKRSFSNSETQITVETERPIPFEGRTVSITASNAGNGRVASDYEFEYFPEEVFQECPSSKEPIVEQRVEFTCRIDPANDIEQTRNLIISTSYKYIKAPTLDIRVVDTR